jgi:hypothetical protein
MPVTGRTRQEAVPEFRSAEILDSAHKVAAADGPAQDTSMRQHRTKVLE